jgi:hypothetical protein
MGDSPLKLLSTFLVVALAAAAPVMAWETRTQHLSGSELAGISVAGPTAVPTCTLSYYYLIDGCGLVSIASGISENQTVGVRFNMAEAVPWYAPCDTNACLTLDAIKIVLYDVLAPPADQSMNLRIYASDESGRPEGPVLGNVDFAPPYGDGGFTTSLIDFTNEGEVAGLDLSSAGGDCVALLTWTNTTGHPGLVLDVVSACVDSCATNAACCAMGVPPYTYPRTDTRTYDYGTGIEPGEPAPICDPAESGETCPAYGYVEAVWSAYFCSTSAAVRPATWGAVKALYR